MAAPHSTHELVKKAQAGDEEALATLFELTRARLHARLESRMGRRLRLRVDVEDVLQETLVWATKSIQRFRWRGEDSFFQWLRGIADHMVLKAAGEQRRNSCLELVRDVAGDDVSPSRMMKRQERFERLESALENLSPEYREAIILCRVEGLRVKDVAKRMSRSPNAVSLILSKALKKLRAAIGDTESLHLPEQFLGAEEVKDD